MEVDGANEVPGSDSSNGVFKNGRRGTTLYRIIEIID